MRHCGCRPVFMLTQLSARPTVLRIDQTTFGRKRGGFSSIFACIVTLGHSDRVVTDAARTVAKQSARSSVVTH